MNALTIAGSDSGGGAGIQADLKTFATLGVHGVCVITSLTAQNTLGVRGVFEVPPEFIRAQFRAVHEDFEIKAAKTGMLGSKEVIKMVAKEVGDYPLIVDPVMVAQTGGELLKKDAVETMRKELFPKATLVTPNIAEAEVLSKIKIGSMKDMKEACRIISSERCNVLVKGGHLNAVDVLYCNGRYYEFRAEKLDMEVHGSGCTFASAITAELAKGSNLLQAVENAKEFVTKAIIRSYKPGKGVSVMNQFDVSLEGNGGNNTLLGLRKVVKKIEDHKNFYKLIPEVGVNIAYALPNAKGLEDVAAVSGRIVRVGDRAKAVGEIRFGASKHVATLVLTAMRFDKSMRSGMNIRYSKEIVEECNKLGFGISSFSREGEPKRASSMEWGTEQAIKKFNAVPDIIYDLGAIGKEPMVRILGKSPKDIFRKVNKILQYL